MVLIFNDLLVNFVSVLTLTIPTQSRRHPGD